MLSRREKLLIHPWQEKNYKNHKRKIQSAKSAIDFNTPPPQYNHVKTKLKKLQIETERLNVIKMENIRLLQRLGNIMNTKFVKNFWLQPRPNFLNREKIILNRSKTCKGRLQNSFSTTTKEKEQQVQQQQQQQKQVEEEEKGKEKQFINKYQRDHSQCHQSSSNIAVITKKKKFPYCSVCSGKIIKRNQVIPEERIPWEPPRKSWNIKIYTKNYQQHKCCNICCKQ